MKKINWKNIKAVITDFDGVMTDNKVIVDQDGREAVVCNRADGWAVGLLKEAGFLVACISTEENTVVAARCKKLKMLYWHGQKDKYACLKQVCLQHNIALHQVAYLGNDTNDMECLRHCGVAVVPADAHVSVKRIAHLQTKSRGGQGVLRELADLLLAKAK